LVRAASLIAAPGLLFRSAAALRHGQKARIPGLEFDAFGRRLGLRLMRSGHVGLGASYLLNPVSIVRYFEFPFVAASIPAGAKLCADVSSPRLFSLFWAAKHPEAAIQMINPDEHDLEETRVVAESAGVALELVNVDLSVFRDRPHAYDAIWSISVLEHVHGEYDDREAIAWLYSALRPGGVLAVTTTIDRVFWDEYRDADPYGLVKDASGPVFFQRWYDLAAIQGRLIDPLHGARASLAFFGEKRPGMFKAYEAEWMRGGMRRSVEDPRDIADDFREFSSWDEMPGAGVCGIRIVKPDS
jgi:SAM-dependent methyltransferase